jgi:hypothetical protein
MEDHDKITSIPQSPSRSKDTALLNEELMAQDPTVPDYVAIDTSGYQGPNTPKAQYSDVFVQSHIIAVSLLID